MSATLPYPSEAAEQCALVQWADLTRLKDELAPGTIGEHLFAIPNGGARHRAVAGQLKAQGVRAGVPDLMLAIPRNGYAGLFVEMKRQQGGSTSPAQRDWSSILTRRGYLVVVTHGWRAAQREILSYLYPNQETD